jgi:hypothetical protein
LFREGKITRAQYQEVRIKALHGARRIGAYLVNEGYLKGHELFAAVRGQLSEIIYGVLEFDTGSFRYHPIRAGEDDRVGLELPFPALVLEGIRRKWLLPRLVQQLGGPGSLLGPMEGTDFTTEVLLLTADEKSVLRLLDGTRNIEDLVFATGLPAVRVYHALFALVRFGLATILVRGLETSAVQGDPQSDNIDRTRIFDKYTQVQTLDYFQILGVATAATPFEIDRAYERAQHEFSDQRFSPGVREELHEQLREIHEVLGDARDILREDMLREAYGRSVR